MSTSRHIAVIVGSLRKESLNRKLAQALSARAPEGVTLSIIEIADLPHFSQDWEDNPPQSVIDFRARIKPADAVLFVTPEYNRSIPGVLKNAIDIASRPYGEGVWIGKPGAIISASPGPTGGFGAAHHLRQIASAVGLAILPQPEVYVGGVDKLIDANGKLDERTEKFLDKFLTAFTQWIARNAQT